MTTKTTIFLGLDDQDARRQLVTSLEARRIVSEMLVNYFGFGTIVDAAGVYSYSDRPGIANENTICVILYGVSRRAVVRFCQDLKKRFNQQSVLFERSLCFIKSV